MTSSPANSARMTSTHSRQAGVAHRLVRPASTGDVLVRRLARAEGDPQPAGVHLQQRRHGLGDDRRVVALAGRGDDAERQVRRRQRGSQPRPGEPGVALTAAPRSEVVRRHRRRRSRRPRQRARQRAARSGRSARAMRANRRSSPAWGSPLGGQANPSWIRIPPRWWGGGERAQKRGVMRRSGSGLGALDRKSGVLADVEANDSSEPVRATAAVRHVSPRGNSCGPSRPRTKSR